MQKILSVLIAIAFAAVLTPAASAETVSTPYTGSAGFNVAGAGLALVVCPAGCDLDGDGSSDVDPIGGSRLVASTVYSNVIVSLQDDVYGSGAAVSACFWNPEGDNVCDDDDYGSDWVCGTVPLLGSVFPANEVTVWAITILVSEDLDACGAVSGTISGDFF